MDLIYRKDAIEAIYKALRMSPPDYRKEPFRDSMSVAVAMAGDIPSARTDDVRRICDRDHDRGYLSTD